jgi:transcriptional regulator with XRE-family HTH domain
MGANQYPHTPIRATFAAASRDTRLRLDLTQEQVATAVGITRSHYAKIERGEANPGLEMVARIAEALGLELELVARPPSFAKDMRQRDLGHARCSGYVSRRLQVAGWQVAREAPIRDGRWRGWVDILAFSPHTGVLLIIEIKTRLEDVGAIERQIGWYTRSAWAAARDLGWQPRRASPWLLALASDEVEVAIRANRLLLAQAFPRRALDMLAELDGAGAGASAPGMALIDPARRGRRWILPSRSDGRRSPAPYRDYADAVRRWAA